MFALRRVRLPLSCARGTPAAARFLSVSVSRYNGESSSTPASTSTASPPSPRETPSFFNPAEGDTKPFFITTPIFYVNASPHIGHLHSVVLADVFARFARLRQPDRPVVFSTGTDEHGLKIQQAAAKNGMTEHEFCDEVSARFRNLSELANISHTDFIRTSEPRHYAAVEAFWAKLVASGAVYKGSHSGWYSVSDECFYSDKQVDKVDGKMVSTETGSEVMWQEEENWKFRLSMFAPQLREWLQNAESVSPPKFNQEILLQTSDMQDLSISRPSSRVKWGVPVPGDDSQTIYVWVDALINYITVAGYPAQHAAWPADMHVVGKDIIRFHALHWPALLAAAGEPLPKRVLSHAHWTMGRAKMSKSRGNVADPLAAMETYGADGVRWYLMRVGGSLPEDADYSPSELATAYALLQDQVGNLVSRMSTARLLEKMGAWKPEERDAELDAALAALRDGYEARFERYELGRATASLLDVISAANKLFTDRKPWAAEDATAAVVYAYSALRLAGILAQPVMPVKAGELLDRLGVPEAERTWAAATWDPENVDAGVIAQRLRAGAEKYQGTTLFPRVEEKDKGEMKVEEKKEKKTKKKQKKKQKEEKEG